MRSISWWIRKVRGLVLRVARDRRGNIAIIAGIALPVLAVGSLGAIEITEIVGARAKLQSNCDGAALQGARELAFDSSSATIERARSAADGAADPLRRRWTVTTTASADTETGKLTVAQDAWRASFFGNLFPPGGFHLHVGATAAAASDNVLCVLALSGSSTAMYLTKAGSLTAPDCGSQSNGGIQVDAAARLLAGSVRAARSANGPITPAPQSDAPAVKDPFASMPIEFQGTCTEIPILRAVGTLTLNPGLHCGIIDATGDLKIVLNPGEHYFNVIGLNMSGRTELVGTDVVLIIKDDLAAQFSGQARLSLDGRKSGPYAGFVLVTPRSFTGTLRIAAENAKRLHGTIYLPKGRLEVSGDNVRIADQSPWTVVVADRVHVMDTAQLVINADYRGSTLPRPDAISGIRLTR